MKKVITVFNRKYIFLAAVGLIVLSSIVSFLTAYFEVDDITGSIVGALTGVLYSLLCMCKWDLFEFEIIEKSKEGS